MPEMTAFNAQDFRSYVSSVKKWLNILGITEFDVDFKHEQINAAAEVEIDSEAKTAVFRLTKQAEINVKSLQSVDTLALHEVLHLLMGDMTWAASKAKERDEIIISHEHEVINRLMRVMK